MNALSWAFAWLAAAVLLPVVALGLVLAAAGYWLAEPDSAAGRAEGF